MLQGAQVLTAATMRTIMLKGDGKGGFTQVTLPVEMQRSPVFAWLKTGNNALVSGGNLYGVAPYEGQYDASYGNTLAIHGEKLVRWVSPVLSGFYARGEIRDIKPIKIAGRKNAFVVALNNAPLKFFAY
jgi:hypothetical protein